MQSVKRKAAMPRANGPEQEKNNTNSYKGISKQFPNSGGSLAQAETVSCVEKTPSNIRAIRCN